MKKFIALFVLLTLLGTAGLSGCSTDNGKADSAAPATASSTKQDALYLMAGKIEVGQKADLKSAITAKVVKINVDLGSTVQKGDPLIQLDSRDLQAQVTQAGAALNQVQAALTGAKADYTSAKENYNRNNQLYQVGAISQAELEQCQNALAAAEAAQNSYQAQLEQAQSALKAANLQLDNSTITSPLTGVVSAKNINNGELVAAGASLLTVVDPESLLVNAYLPGEMLNEIGTGQQVVIKIPDLSPKEYNGEIAAIDPVVDAGSKTALIKVRFQNREPQLKAGMFAEVGVRN
jgi:RND family efflux transporter MFP subunit